MEKNNIEIKERAEKILRNNNITTLRDENEIMQILLNIANSEVVDENCDKTLDYIEDYLIAKNKMQTAKEDMAFLQKLAEALRNQDIRKTDVCRPPLFKIKDSNNEDIYFLTRQALKEYEESNKIEHKDVIVVQENKNTELTRLLDVIERNF